MKGISSRRSFLRKVRRSRRVNRRKIMTAKPDSKKTHDQLIAEDLLARGLAKAKTMGLDSGVSLVPDALPIQSFDAADDDTGLWVDFENSDTQDFKKIYPWRTCGVFKKKSPETEEQKKQYLKDHSPVKCILRSTVALESFGEVDDLNFWANGTSYDPITFWNIPANKKVIVPRWVVEHINKTCQRFELEYEDETPDNIARQIQSFSMGMGQTLVKKFKRSTFRFERSA
jgi:hypothetical protein